MTWLANASEVEMRLTPRTSHAPHPMLWFPTPSGHSITQEAVVEVLRGSPKHMVCLNLTTRFDSLRIADRDCERRGLIHTPRQVVVYILISCGGVQYPDEKLNGLHNLPRDTIGHICPRIRKCSRLHELVYIHCVGIRRVVASWLTGHSGITLSGAVQACGRWFRKQSIMGTKPRAILRIRSRIVQ